MNRMFKVLNGQVILLLLARPKVKTFPALIMKAMFKAVAFPLPVVQVRKL